MVKGREWLESNLDVLFNGSHPFEISLVTLVLHVMKSTQAEKAFGILARNARHQGKVFRKFSF